MPTCPAGDIKGESKLQLKRSKTQDQTAGQVPQRKKCSRHLTTLTSFPSYTSFVLTSGRETNSIKFNQIPVCYNSVGPSGPPQQQNFSPSALQPFTSPVSVQGTDRPGPLRAARDTWAAPPSYRAPATAARGPVAARDGPSLGHGAFWLSWKGWKKWRDDEFFVPIWS